MAYANILVSVDLDEATPDRIRLAAGLAQRFEATLTGAAACALPMPVFFQDIGEIERRETENKEKALAALERARAVFAACAETVARTDWQTALAEPARHLVARARAADLVVVRRQGTDDDPPGPFGVAPGAVLMEAGRPVLVVPPRIAGLRAARIVVAWKDGVAARRAVSAALPFMREADQVFVASAGPGAHHEGAEEVATHLARHGAPVTTHLLRTAVSDGDELLRFARKQEADLIVMGAYGHARLREWMFGGVTRDVLQHSPFPCLMCH